MSSEDSHQFQTNKGTIQKHQKKSETKGPICQIFSVPDKVEKTEQDRGNINKSGNHFKIPLFNQYGFIITAFRQMSSGFHKFHVTIFVTFGVFASPVGISSQIGRAHV